ncbi:MAG TPA: alpha/beta hydrolase-fold protein [Longimicrobiaceae bacterium]|nr:alpha/beta hydrolase-fold protein [Longimicrobiaceae bacterium]
MKPLALSLALLLAAQPVAAQAGLGPPEPAVEGEVRALRSPRGEDLRLHVRLPASYGQGGRRYPVLYVLDPAWNLGHAASTARFLAAGTRMPEVIVVGVEVGDRSRDFTPTHFTGPGGLPDSGGGPAFLERLAEEVVPAIDAAYRTQPLRVLAGHSLGGLFAAWAFAERPGLFRGVVALDPSLWWEEGAVAGRIASRLRSAVRAGMLVVAEGAESREAALIADSVPPGVRWSRVVVRGESHQSMPLLGLYDGLGRLFADYVPRMRHDADLARTDALLAQYRELSSLYGYEVAPPETALREVAQRALNRRDGADAARAAELLTRLYPASQAAREAAARASREAAAMPEIPPPPAPGRVDAEAAAPFLGTWRGVLDHEPGQDVPVTIVIERREDRLAGRQVAHGVALDGSDLRQSYVALAVRGDTLELWSQSSGGGYIVATLTPQPDGSLSGTQEPRHVPLPPGMVLPDVRVTVRLERTKP